MIFCANHFGVFLSEKATVSLVAVSADRMWGDDEMKNTERTAHCREWGEVFE